MKSSIILIPLLIISRARMSMPTCTEKKAAAVKQGIRWYYRCGNRCIKDIINNVQSRAPHKSAVTDVLEYNSIVDITSNKRLRRILE